MKDELQRTWAEAVVLMKNMQNLGRDSNQTPPGFKSEALPLQPACSVLRSMKNAVWLLLRAPCVDMEEFDPKATYQGNSFITAVLTDLVAIVRS
jgi:hypothetical protein